MAYLRTLNTHKINFYRPGDRQLSGGEYLESPQIDLGIISGSLQELAQGSKFGALLKVLPSGIDIKHTKVFLSTTQLRASNRYQNYQSDYCILAEGIFDIFQAGDWNIPGFSTSHYFYVLIKRPDDTGDIPR